MNVQQLLESSKQGIVNQNTVANKLVAKWTKSGLLEGLKNDIEKNTMAVLLENQARSVLSEANITGGNNSQSGGAGENWAGVALPLVRRVFGEIVTKDFFSVQPMTLPSGLVFYLDFKYATSKANFTSGTSLYGNQATNHPNVQGLEVDGGLYGDGKFGYSFNLTSSAAVLPGTGSVSSADVNFDSRFVSGSLSKISVTTSSLTSLDVEGVKAIAILSASVQYPVLQQFTKVVGSNVQFIVSSSTLQNSASLTFQYPKATTPDARGDFEDRTGADLAIPSIDVSLKSEAIVAKTRKLKAQYTPEFAQDLNAYHNLDAEQELTGMLSNYIALEVDLELLDMLRADAATTGYWSANNNEFWNGTGFTQTSSTTGGFYNTQGGWFSTLGTTLQTISNKVHQKTFKGGCNFMIVSPAVATILESIAGYASDGNGEKEEFNFGITKMGTLNSRYKVYKNPYQLSNEILMGYKGAQFLDTGAVYAPYIPLMMTPLIYDPTNFTPRKGMMTRYAKKMVRPEFYAKVYVKGLESLGF